MATAPVKSQPLHNFDLPHLRWAHKNHHSPHSNNATHNRFRRRDLPDLHHHVGNNSNSNTVTTLSLSNTVETDLDLVPVRDDTSAQASKTSSLAPRKPFSLSSSSSQQNHQQKDAAAVGLEKDKEKDYGVEEGESEAKPWKLRPRKVVTFPTTSFKKADRMLDETVFYQKKDNSGGGCGCGHLKSSRVRATVVEGTGPGTGHRSTYGSVRQRIVKKRRLWISLSRRLCLQLA